MANIAVYSVDVISGDRRGNCADVDRCPGAGPLAPRDYPASVPCDSRHAKPGLLDPRGVGAGLAVWSKKSLTCQ